MASNRGRTGKAYRRLRALVLATESECWVCAMPVDCSLPGTDRDGPTLDHVLEVDRHPELMLNRSNARLAHKRCNSKRGAEYGNAKTNHGHSRDW